MYPRIPWEMVADPLGSMEHTLGATDVGSLMSRFKDDEDSYCDATNYATV